jgi:hypothetical protein
VTDLLDLNQLALVGLVALALALAVGLLKYLLRAGLLSRLSAAGSERTVLALLHQVFLLALPVLVLGLLSYMLPHLLAPHLGRLDGGQLLGFTALLVGGAVVVLAFILYRFSPPRTDHASGGDRTAADDSLLPWLVNRGAQKQTLRAAVSAYLAGYSGRQARPPLLCLIHGSAPQHCRIHEHLEQYLKVSHPTVFNGCLHPRFKPDTEGAGKNADLSSLLASALDADFSAKFSNGRQALVVRGVIHARDSAHAVAWLPQLAAFWQQYCGNVPCLVLLCVKYTTADSHALESLDTAAFEAKFGLPGVILPSLTSISIDQVEAWADRHADEIANSARLLEQISTFYESQNALPMRTLGLKLQELLQPPA